MSRLTADLLRVLSIIAVMVIHATGAGERDFLRRHDFMSDGFFAVLLNQLARFAVPVFVMLSGYGLTRKYLSVSKVPLTFFRERAWKIALPYLFWSLVILAALRRTPMEVAASLARGSADYHFYFFVIIIQCYLLFPLLFRTLGSGRGFRTVFWILLLAVHLLLTQPAQYLYLLLGWPVPHWHNSLFVFWIFYFYSGMLLGQRGPVSVGRKSRMVLVGGTLGAFALMVGEYVYRSYHNPVVDYYNHFNRHSVVLYSFCVWGLFAAFDARVSAFLEARPRFMQAVTYGAGLSFFVYIFHTWILRGLERTFFAYEVIVLIVVLTAISFGLARLVHGVLPAGGRVMDTVRTILGLPPNK